MSKCPVSCSMRGHRCIRLLQGPIILLGKTHIQNNEKTGQHFTKLYHFRSLRMTALSASFWLYPSWYPRRGWEWFRQGEMGKSFKHTEYNKSAFILFEHVHKLSSESILKLSFLLEEYLTFLLFLFFSFCPKYAWQNPTNNNTIILYFSIVVLSCQNHSTHWLMGLHSCHCESGNNESYYL